MEHVRRDPIQPRQDAPTGAAGSAPRESERERLRRQLVGKFTSRAAMQVPVYGTEVAIEDQLERSRFAERACQALGVRGNIVHTLTVPEVQMRVSATVNDRRHTELAPSISS